MIEVIVLGLLFLIPLMWALGVLAELHRTALASAAAAREAGADAARSDGVGPASSAVQRAVARAMIDHGLDPTEADVDWQAGRGFERGSSIEIVVSYPVSVLRAPFLGSVGGPSITVRASHVAVVEPYASRDR
jgi:hypothetical protein